LPSYQSKSSHHVKTNAFLITGVGFLFILSSAFILYDPENAWMSIISYGISFLTGIIISAIINRGLGYMMGIRRNKTGQYSINYKFTQQYFSSTYKWLTIIIGIIIGLWINSLPGTNQQTVEIYNSIIKQGL